MIYTATFNSFIDYTMFTDGFELKRLSRARETYKFAGGKGVNVSRILKTLDVPSTALGLTGGFPGEFISSILEQNDVNTEFIKVNKDTRISAKLKSGDEAGVNAPGPNVTSKQFETLSNQIRHISKEDVVIAAGSVPKGIPGDAYAQIAKIAQETGVKLVVDAERDSVNTVLEYHPLFIKPNKNELEEMSDVTIKSDQDVVKYDKEIVRNGAQSVVISLDGDSAIYIDETRSIKTQNPKGEVVNTIGSGDNTVIGMVAGLELGPSFEEAFCQVVASSTTTASSDDSALREDIEKTKSQVTISVLDGE